jgi:uncharacterized protein YceK
MNIYERLALWLVFCVLMTVIFTSGCTVVTSSDPQWQYPVNYSEGLK